MVYKSSRNFNIKSIFLGYIDYPTKYPTTADCVIEMLSTPNGRVCHSIATTSSQRLTKWVEPSEIPASHFARRPVAPRDYVEIVKGGCKYVVVTTTSAGACIRSLRSGNQYWYPYHKLTKVAYYGF